MDFHSLTRRELQSLCKLNKIPANITNVAMADALQSLQTVVGIEDFLKVSQSETTADLVESVGEKVEGSSPKAPQTRCKTSTRQKAKTAEDSSTVLRTTRRGSKQPSAEVKESKNDQLKTPAVSRTCRKAAGTASCRNVNYQLNECENEEPKQVGLVENKYSTRRSTRLTEKKSAAPTVKKGTVKAVKIDSFVDQVNVTTEEPFEVLQNSVETGNSNAEVEDVCNAFEKLDVIAKQKSGEEDEDCDEVDNLKQESDETTHSWEDSGDLEDNLKISEMKTDQVYDLKPESEATHKSGEEEDEDCDEVDNLKQESDKTTHSWEDSGDLEDNLKISEMKTDQVYDLKPKSEATHKSGEEEDEDCDEGSNLKHETSNSCDIYLKISELKTDDVYDLNKDSENIPISSKDENLVSGGNFVKEHNHVMVQEEHSGSDDTSSPLEDESLGQREELFDAISGDNVNAVEENSFGMVQEKSSDSQLDNNASTESGADADAEMNFQVPESNESSTVVSLIIDDTKNPIEAKEEMSKNIVDANVVDVILNVDNHSIMTEKVEDLKPEFFTENNANEKSDADPLILSEVMVHPTHVTPIKKATPFKNALSVVSDNKENILDEGKHRKKEFFTENNANEKSDADPLTLSEVMVHPTHVTSIKKATPFKNALSVVSDNKENIVDEGKHRKKEIDEMEKKKSLNEMSIRQLKKQLKALTLNTLNSKEAASATTRPALQALSENQMVVGGETKN